MFGSRQTGEPGAFKDTTACRFGQLFDGRGGNILG
jgi:hypothetical protein